MWSNRNTPPLLVQPLCESICPFLRKLVMSGLEDPAILLLGIYPEDSPVCNKNTFSTMFIAALFLIARSGKEPRHPLKGESMQKCDIYVYIQWSPIQTLETKNS